MTSFLGDYLASSTHFSTTDIHYIHVSCFLLRSDVVWLNDAILYLNQRESMIKGLLQFSEGETLSWKIMSVKVAAGDF